MLEITKQEKENLDPNQLRIRLGIKVIAWTDRMLAALVNGVKGNKWFSLIDKITSKSTILQAWELVKKNQGAPGVDKVTIEKFEAGCSKYLDEIQKQVSEGTFKPLQIRRVYIPKDNTGKKLRPLGIPCVKDRILQTAIKLIIEPIFEYEFADTSYGFRPGRGCKDALRRVQQNLDQGYTYIVDADLKTYFDTIPHDKLMNRVKEKIGDGKVLELVEDYLKQGILEECKEWIPTQGCPQGAVISPLLANLYLHPLDKLMELNEIRIVRYADDLVIMCKNKEEAEKAYTIAEKWINENGLTLNFEKTHIGNCMIIGQGFEFLGYKFENGQRHVRQKSLTKFKDKIRDLTKRTNGKSIDYTINKLNRTLKGWYNYFKHVTDWTFERIDGWIRRRLRSILKRQKKGNGMGKTLDDHKRWPNKFFANAGLFSLVTAFKMDVSALKAAKAS